MQARRFAPDLPMDLGPSGPADSDIGLGVGLGLGIGFGVGVGLPVGTVAGMVLVRVVGVGA